MQKCIVCGKVPGIEKRVNNEGLIFCSDDCYDAHDNSPNDFSHPYIDDYEAIRLEYIWWMENFENEMDKLAQADDAEREEILEGFDALFLEFYDYYQLEGNDGVFSQEIYNYLLALEEIRVKIENWKTINEE